MLHMASRNVCFLLNSVFWTCYQVIHYSYKIVVFDSCMLSYLCTFGQTVLYIIPIPKWCAFRLFLGFLIFLKLVVYAEKSPIQSPMIYWVLLGGRQRIKEKKKQPLITSSPASCNMHEVNLHEKLSPAFKFHKTPFIPGSHCLGEFRVEREVVRHKQDCLSRPRTGENNQGGIGLLFSLFKKIKW